MRVAKSKVISPGDLPGVGEATAEADDRLSKDTTFELLKSRRRRDALQYLKANEGEAKLGELAEHIAAKENDIEVSALSSDQRKRVYVGLYQCHLPKMQETGVIDFNKNRGTIALREAHTQLEPYLEESGDDSDKRMEAYVLALTALVGVVVSAGVLGLTPLDAVPHTGWAVLSTSALVLVTLVETYQQ